MKTKIIAICIGMTFEALNSDALNFRAKKYAITDFALVEN